MSVQGASLVCEVPDKLRVHWHPTARAIIDTWTSYDITLEEFRTAVLERGLNHGTPLGVQAWIVDSHAATGAFSPEIQTFIGTDVFPAFARNGVKYFMTITAESTTTRKTVAQYSAETGTHGLKLLQGASAQGAIDWLIENT